MAMKAEEALAMAKSYTKKSLEGAGALKGQDGKDGTDGKSAYQIAVDNGFQGTEEEWIASLKGSDGKDGEDGENYDDTEIKKDISDVQEDLSLIKTVNVRTGKFIKDESSGAIYTKVNTPLPMPIISKGKNEYICTSEQGANYFFVCSDIETENWVQKTPNIINIKQIEYIESVGYYYMLTVDGGAIYFSEDLETWNPMNMINLLDNPNILVNADNTIYVITTSGEVGTLNRQNPQTIDSLDFSYQGTTDVFEIHNCYVVSNDINGIASIYDNIDLTELETKKPEDGTDAEVYKIVYWNGYLVGISYNRECLYISNARFRDEIINSPWIDLSSMLFRYYNGNQTYADTLRDIIVFDGRLYVICDNDIYRIENDFSIVGMSDVVQVKINAKEEYARKCNTDNGFVYRISQNETILFKYETEDISIGTALKNIYNKIY